MEIDVEHHPIVDCYKLLVGLVVPRPIAWVTTISEKGVVNLAPFSFFNLFGANPPVVVLSPTLTRDGSKKDTLVNIEANGEFVIHASTEQLAESINSSSKALPRDQSEVEWLELPTLPSSRVTPPRLAGTAFALECRARQIVPVGDGPISANLVIGQIVYIHVNESILGDDGQPDPRKLKAVSRLGGEFWGKTQDLFVLPRP